MAEPKTKANRKSVNKFLSNIEHPQRREDAFVLLEIFSRLTNKKPVMWGDSIVGFGSYAYENTLGKARWPVTGFSPRKQNLSLYFMRGFSKYSELLDKLGKSKQSKSCLYINKLSDVDLNILEQLILLDIADMQANYPCR